MSLGAKIKKFFPLRITTMAVAKNRMNLLYIIADETSHYILVQDLSRLVSRQYNNHKNKTYFCLHCLHGCSSEEGTKNRAPGTWRQEGTWQSQVYKKQNTSYAYLFSSTRISKTFYINKTRVSHRYQSSSPSSTSNMYHVGTASMGNAVVDNNSKKAKWI